MASAAAVAAQDAGGLVAQAREAAWADRNAEAVTLYEQAFEADPNLRSANLREYADQLIYSGRSGDAIPLYRQVLRGRVSQQERRTTERGLALALTWSGQPEAAVEVWDRVITAAPDDMDARQNRDKQLLEAARTAARADRNAQAASLLARVLKTHDRPPAALVREYADQLTYTGQHARALGLYNGLLRSGGLGADEQARVRRGRALALQWSGQPEPAAQEWSRVLRANPADRDARKNLGAVLIDQARLAAQAGQNADAVTLFETAFRNVPSLRSQVLGEYAHQLTYAGQAAAAVPLFEEIVRSGNEGAVQDGYQGLGRSLAWSDRHIEALNAFDRGLSRYPDDVGLLTGKAQVLIWMDRTVEARSVYARAMRVDADNETAVRGVAQADSYLGRQRQASARLEEVIARGDASADTLMVAARAEYWKGRPDKAFALADRVLSDTPGHSGALDLVEEIDDAMRPTSSFYLRHSTQNDGLEILTQSGRHGLTFNSGLSGAGVQVRRVVLNPDAGSDVVIEGPGLFFRHRFNDDVEVNGSFHLNRVTAAGVKHRALTYDSWLTFWRGDTARFDLSLSRALFDDERSVAANIQMTSIGASADYFLSQDAKLSAQVSFGSLSDGNSRMFLQVEAQRDAAFLEGLHLGGRLTYFGFSDDHLNNGYFNPSWLYSAEGTARYQYDLNDKWRLEARGTLGFERRADLDKVLWTLGAKASYALTDDVAMDFEIEHNDHRRVDAIDGFSRTSFGSRLVYKW